MYTKQINLDIDWLSNVDGMTVRQAIEYLSTLQDSHILSYNMEGDTHGCEVVSNVSYDEPMTTQEIKDVKERQFRKELNYWTKAEECLISGQWRMTERNFAERMQNIEVRKQHYIKLLEEL